MSSIEELTRSSVQALEEVENSEPQDLSPTADLLEALRRKRASANTTFPVESQPFSEPEHYFPTVETHEDSLEANGSAAAVEEVSPAPVTPPTKKGRPSMPSWDEIVFGTKTDD